MSTAVRRWPARWVGGCASACKRFELLDRCHGPRRLGVRNMHTANACRTRAGEQQHATRLPPRAEGATGAGRRLRLRAGSALLGPAVRPHTAWRRRGCPKSAVGGSQRARIAWDAPESWFRSPADSSPVPCRCHCPPARPPTPPGSARRHCIQDVSWTRLQPIAHGMLLDSICVQVTRHALFPTTQAGGLCDLCMR